MKLRILKPATLAGMGTFKPGTVVVIPNDVAEGWLRSGKARVEDGTPWSPEEEVKVGAKLHKHYYRKDGTCACGHVRRVKAKAKPKTQIEPDPVSEPESAPEPESGPE